MGVYGLILFDAKSKRKAIAIHKVNGASKSNVILMLNRNLIIRFTIAYMVAVPLAYYVVNRWLEGFAYKTPIYWWVFILSGMIVFVISIITVSWQSYRAASVNPVEAIKNE
jgi:putative ABC transport system permease protein